ncbi:KaiC/GvpD/RAD55 family RecA-like ATPase [Azospirillum fermentarium]|uniref:AAA family ATPase n=1 Tax=Azospirillum fermentarium TaxID=1233114 RepID=UPI002226A4E4|nr:AAA family ATPase [Azospirillum fermentarium]MCW2244737.1 KaiC/GvpD/RAD55 family RecA-like ATPase [Azospirillum fermentarium]
MTALPSAAEISDILRRCRRDWLPAVFPAGRIVSGVFYIGSPHGEPGSSLPIPLNSERAETIRDFSGGFSGDDLDLYQEARGLSRTEAMAEAAQRYGGITVTFGQNRPRSQPKPPRIDRPANANAAVIPLSIDPATPVPALHRLGQPASVWEYYDAANRLVMRHCRFDETDSDGHPALDARGKRRKQFRPLIRTAAGMEWKWPTPVPLYHLPDLLANPSLPVLVVEGEKSADIGCDLIGERVVVTWAGGSAGIARADWSPLQGRDVTIWPDNDEAGAASARKVVAEAVKAGACSVRVVALPQGLPETWDLADPLPEGWTDEDLERLIAEALPAEGVGPAVAPAGYQPGALDFVWFGDIAVDLDTMELVEGVLTPGALSVVYGESNCGKTFFATDLALHIALGWRWRDRHVVQGAVIYVAAEGGKGVMNRIAAFRRHYDIASAPPFAVIRSSVNLLDPDRGHTEALIAAITHAAQHAGMPVALVVIDTLSRAMAGGNENASEDMGALVMNADRIRQETGAHLMFVHHSGKDTSRGARGHSLLRAATDTEIEVSREGAETPSVARITKQRDLETNGEFVFTLTSVELGRNPLGKPVTSCIVTPAEREAPSDGSGKRRGSNPPPAAQRYAEALLNAMIAHGETRDGKRGTTLQHWRDECVRLGLIPGGEDRDDQRRRSTNFNKNKSLLVEHSWVACDGDFAWSIRSG